MKNHEVQPKAVQQEKIKMGIDKETQIGITNIVINDSKKYLDSLRTQAEEDGQNEEYMVEERGSKALSVTNDKHSFRMEEYYFEESDNTLHISGEFISSEGKTSIYLDIPLSDIVLIDILKYAIKKLNKLKTAMETLK